VRGDLIYASELLRRAWQPGFVPAFPELAHEDLSDAEVHRLRAALAAFYERPSHSGTDRRFALWTLAKDPASDVVPALIRELHFLLEAHRIIDGDMFQVLLALRDHGEPVYPPEKRSFGLLDIQENVHSAEQYLLSRGHRIPR
jgi:hypothetical protein